MILRINKLHVKCFTYVHAFGFFEECVGHATTDDHLVDFVQKVFDQLDLVGHFGTAQDCQEWPENNLNYYLEPIN